MRAGIITASLFLFGCDQQAPQAKLISDQQGPSQDPAEETLVFKRVMDVVPAGKTQVINGEPVHASDWPALLIAEIRRVVDGRVVASVCSATLVGPRVLLTAAHCVDTGSSTGRALVKLELPELQKPATATCTIDSDYLAGTYVKGKDTPRNSADHALCLLDVDLSAIEGYKSLEYEIVDRDSAPTQIKKALVTGYGCTKIELDKNCKPIFPPIDTVLRAGGVTISGYPSSGTELNYLQALSVSKTEAALCKGDSGGPLISRATLKDQTAERYVVGVASSISFPQCDVGTLISRFAALGTASFRKFSTDWEASAGHPVFCGVNQKRGESPCRD